jgi:hypothetical protein
MGCSVLTDKFNTNKTNTKQNKMTTKNLFRSWKSINQTIKQSEEESNFMPKKQNKSSQVKSIHVQYSTITTILNAEIPVNKINNSKLKKDLKKKYILN